MVFNMVCNNDVTCERENKGRGVMVALKGELLEELLRGGEGQGGCDALDYGAQKCRGVLVVLFCESLMFFIKLSWL